MEECKNLKSRIANDKKKGRTTSQAVVDFIRRTCACDQHREWRRAQQKQKAVSVAVPTPSE
jgi:hypothetical protein